MAPTKKRNVSADKTSADSGKKAKIDFDSKVEGIIESRKHANDVFDILECLQSDREKEVVAAVSACSKLFCCLLEKRAMFVGKLPQEEDVLTGSHSADEKYGMFMRHRYSSCVEMLLELLSHESHQVKEAALCCLMKFAAGEGQRPLEDLDWSEHYSFPRELIQAVVDRLLCKSTDTSLLISRFQEFLEMEDVRFYVMSAVRENLAVLSSISFGFPRRCAFLPSNMYKKVLVILHDSILPHMSKPTLMIDFLTAAYEVGGAISLLALNGLFVLIHQHNLDYPDFYKKLYNLLEPSVFHVKYRARFFHLANLFLSSSHLPVYLVAAFAKRLARLALTAPPAPLLMLLPFIYNLIRRHPSSRVLIHRPSTGDDPYLMDEEDPAQCRALESSLWEIKTLQKHFHPDVAKAAMLISAPLSEQEDDISELLEITTYELMERDLKETQTKSVPLEFELATQLLQGGGRVLGQHFCLD
uniref:Nucleolar complex associated 4 homolog n=1 Tax=Myripristis murdjan TaxID=586833 RepID=A0A668A5E2_9TELE